MKYYKFVWRTGAEEVGCGMSVSDAFMKLGYGGGATGALLHYVEISGDEYLKHQDAIEKAS